MKNFGSAEPLLNFMDEVGINTENMAAVPSLCLGSEDISVFEMTGAYNIFANKQYEIEK